MPAAVMATATDRPEFIFLFFTSPHVIAHTNGIASCAHVHFVHQPPRQDYACLRVL